MSYFDNRWVKRLFKKGLNPFIKKQPRSIEEIEQEFERTMDNEKIQPPFMKVPILCALAWVAQLPVKYKDGKTELFKSIGEYQPTITQFLVQQNKLPVPKVMTEEERLEELDKELEARNKMRTELVKAIKDKSKKEKVKK